MKFRYTIGRRISTGFGVIILALIVVFIIIIRNTSTTTEMVDVSQQLEKKIKTIFDPSYKLVDSLSRELEKSEILIKRWAKEESKDTEPWKQELISITEKVYPELRRRIRQYEKHWDKKEIQLIEQVFHDVDSMLVMYKIVRDTLPDLASYQVGINYLVATTLVEEDQDIDRINNKIRHVLTDIINRKRIEKEKNQKAFYEARDKVLKSTESTLKIVIILAISLVIGTILIATFTTRSIVRPVQGLKRMLLMLGKGIIPRHKLKPTNDEIGDMSVALSGLIDGFQRTTEFSRQVGIGNFNYNYEPLSEDDVLGHALLKMRDDLAENERILEQKVIERTEEVVRQKEEIEKQRQKLEELYKDVTDSIRYAKRLQESILPPDSSIRNMLPHSFVLYKPKDIVSGDFYWFFKKNNKILFTAVDCTGHGVPGAFMSLVGANALNQSVREHGLDEPAKILDDLNKLSSEALNKNTENNSVRDGMDLAFCALDSEKMQLQFAGANNPLYIVRNKQIINVSPDKFAIGAFDPGSKHYKNHNISLEKNDCIYIFSDGFADQFGGKKGKKFMYKRFRDLLLEINSLAMEEQKTALNEAIEKWRGSYEQIDDILVIGVKV